MSFQSATTIKFTANQVVIAITHCLFGSHIGLAFYPKGSTPHILHLAGHRNVKTEIFPPATDCWIATIVDLPPRASIQMAAFVRAVSSQKFHNINYGINFIAAKGSFDPLGVYTAPSGSDGLTCATFVTEIFHGARLPLIDETTWLPNVANFQWGEDVCALLTKWKVPTTHINSVRANINGLRVHPNEVGAAADTPYTLRPINFSTATHDAPAVKASLDSICI